MSTDSKPSTSPSPTKSELRIGDGRSPSMPLSDLTESRTHSTAEVDRVQNEEDNLSASGKTETEIMN